MTDFTKQSSVVDSRQFLQYDVDSLMQKKRNSIAKALLLRLFCIRPSMFSFTIEATFLCWQIFISQIKAWYAIGYIVVKWLHLFLTTKNN